MGPPPDIDALSVRYHGRRVASVSLTPEGLATFEYDPEWLASGFSVSPYKLRLEPGVSVAPAEPLGGAFGVLDDSLPDGWGRLLVDRTLKAHGVGPASVDLLQRLSIVGSSGMGALEYEPETPVEPFAPAGLDLDRVAGECADVLADRPCGDIDSLFALGGSSGGARPKAFVTLDGDPWIVKFPSASDPKDVGRREQALAEAARDAGVAMAESRLLPSQKCPGYFATKRFDRVRAGDGHEKVHMASACGLLDTSHRLCNLDYETLMQLTRIVCGDAGDTRRLFQQMCLNVLAGNRDDHGKNFSYLYDEEEGVWHLSPAYDVTHTDGAYGERATSVDGKGFGISPEDCYAVGARAGLSAGWMRHAHAAIRDSLGDRGLLDQSP